MGLSIVSVRAFLYDVSGGGSDFSGVTVVSFIVFLVALVVVGVPVGLADDLVVGVPAGFEGGFLFGDFEELLFRPLAWRGFFGDKGFGFVTGAII